MAGEEQDIRDVTEGLVEDLYAGDPDTYAGVRAGFGDEGTGPTYNTVAIGQGTLLAGGAWNGGAADADAPEDGPNPDLDGNSGISLLVRAIALVAHAKTDPSAAPGVNDDETLGYRPGKLWITGTGPTFTIYVLCDASAGAAVWQDLTSGGGGSGTTLTVNGGSVAATCNLSHTTPSAPADTLNVTWQVNGGGTNVSGWIGCDGATIVTGASGFEVGTIAEGQVSGLLTDLSTLAAAIASITITSLGGVPTSRHVDTTAPLLGGGALSSNLTLSVDVDGTTVVVSGGKLAVGAIAESQVTNLTTDLAAKQPLDAGLTALSSLGAGVAVCNGSDGWTAYSTSGSGTVVALATGASLASPTFSSYTVWTDQTANAAATGRLQRNGANLSWHNGTAAKDLAQIAGQLGGSGDSPTVLGLRETGGPTNLTAAGIAANTIFSRDGSNQIVGITTSTVFTGGSPLTTKGDIVVYTSTTTRKGVSGVRGARLAENPDNTDGLEYVDAPDIYYGDGFDGDATIAAGTTTLTVPKSYNNLTVNGTLAAAGYSLQVRGVLTFGASGVISCDGGNASAGTAGTGGGAAAGQFLPGGNGAAGASGASTGGNGSVAANSWCFLRGAAGAGKGGNGGQGNGAGSHPGGTGTTPTGPSAGRSGINLFTYDTGATIGNSAVTTLTGGSGGASGGGDQAGANAGGGGGGGGVVIVKARHVDATAGGTIRALGGNGGNASIGGAATAAGGGGGGGGGFAALHYGDAVSGTQPTMSAAGGTHGTKAGTGADGTDGTAGATEIHRVAA